MLSQKRLTLVENAEIVDLPEEMIHEVHRAVNEFLETCTSKSLVQLKKISSQQYEDAVARTKTNLS